MSFGFRPGTITGTKSEAVLNSMVTGETVTYLIYSVPYEIDWEHENTKPILAEQLGITLSLTGFFQSGGYVSKL